MQSRLCKALLMSLSYLAFTACAHSGAGTAQSYEFGRTLAPMSISSGTTLSREPEDDWWTDFDNGCLSTLVDLTLEQNRTLDAAIATKRSLDATVRLRRADKLPSFTPGGGLTRTISQGNGVTSGAASLGADWEIDLFGRLDLLESGAQFDADAREWLLRDIAVTLISDATSAYIDYIAAKEGLDLALRNLEIQTRTLEQTTRRVEEEVGSKLEATQALQQVKSTEALLPGLRSSQTNAAARLAVVTASRIDHIARLCDFPDRLVDLEIPSSELIPIGDVDGLIRRHPSIRAAQAQALSAGINVDVAELSAFPRIQFGASGSQPYVGPGVSVLGFGPQLIWPGLNPQRVAAQKSVAREVFNSQIATFDGEVLATLAEVEASLEFVANAEDALSSWIEAEKAATQAVRFARRRYEEGLSGFINLLDAERRLLDASQRRLAAQSALLEAYVSLQRGLGAGWRSALLDRSPNGSTSLHTVARKAQEGSLKNM